METNTNEGRYSAVSTWIFSILFIILPVVVLPYLNVGFMYAKIGFIAVMSLVAIALVIIQVVNERKMERPSWPLLAAFTAVPLAYLISALFSPDRTLSLMGLGIDTDTFFFIALGFTSAFLAYRSVRGKQSVFFASLGFMAVALLICLFHLVRFLFGSDFLTLGLFTSATANTVGSFGDLGIYAGLAVVISMLSLEFLPLNKRIRFGLYATLFSALAVACVANFNLVDKAFGLGFPVSLAAVLAIFSLSVFVHKKVTSPKNAFPLVALIVTLITVFFAAQSQSLAQSISAKIGITQAETLDVRVSPSGTATVLAGSYSEGIRESLVGSGPNSFFMAWGRHKPTDPQNSVNASAFWNTDFNSGFGHVPTSFVTTGILGALAWIFFLGFMLRCIYILFKRILTSETDSFSRYSILVSSVSSVYLWIAAVFYTPGPVILFLAFFFTGLLFAVFVREGIVNARVLTWDETGYWQSFITVFALVVSLAALASVGYVWSTRLSASVQAQKAVVILQNDPNAITASEEMMIGALGSYPGNGYLRFFSDLSLVRPSSLIAAKAGRVLPADITTEVAVDITRAIATAERAALAKGSSPDYRDWIQLGKTYEAAAFLGATTTAERAVQAYAQAELLNPTHPTPPYLIGRLFAYARNFPIAKQKLEQAVRLKPNYSEAVSLLNEVNAASSGSPAARQNPLPTVDLPDDVVATSTSRTSTSTPRR